MITIKYKTQDEAEKLTIEYINKGYRLHEVCNHVDGDFLVFGPPTKYHTLNEKDGTWFFDKEQWLKEKIKPKRDKELQETDYMMVYDNRTKLSSTELNELITYRQSLRDITGSISDDIDKPVEPEWPTLSIIGNRKTLTGGTQNGN